MSKPLDARQYSDPQGCLIRGKDGYILLGAGDTPPTDGAAGYAKGAFWFDTDASAASRWLRNDGTVTSADFNTTSGGVDLTGLTATAAELNTLHSQTLTTPAAAGFTGGTGTIYQNSVQLSGGIYKTTILVDLTGLGSSTTDLDVIGQGAAAAAHIGQLNAAQCGATIDAIRVTCLEAPATGVTDIDLYSAVEGTAKFDDLVTGLTETALLTSGGAWSNGAVKGATVCPLSTEYLYLTNGAAGTVGTYTAGKFLIEIFGH